MRKHTVITPIVGLRPFTDNDLKLQKIAHSETRLKRIERENAIKQICLDCDKPAKDCKGNCSCFNATT